MAAVSSTTPFVRAEKKLDKAKTEEEKKNDLELVVVHDPELTRENPVEAKYLKLMRYNRGLLDKDLKPDSKERAQLVVYIYIYIYYHCSIHSFILICTIIEVITLTNSIIIILFFFFSINCNYI